MEPGMWTCTICSLTMAVGDGPSHLASDEHMVHLSNFNGRILEFRLAELNLGLQGFEYVTSDKGMPWRAWPCPDYAPCTIEAEANHADTLTDGLGSTGTTSWVCKTCDRTMHEHSKLEHLAGKAHAKMLGSKSMIPLEDACRKPLISVKNFWTCPSCKAILEVPKKAYHHCSISESKASNIDGPLDEFFHSFASFHYVPSAPPATSFGLLQRYLQQQLKWTHESRENEELWRAYQAALTEEFNLWFGVEDNLEAWQSLCRALRVSPLPATIRLCRTAVQGCHVNIIDLIEWGRDPRNHVKIFSTIKKLSDYSFKSGKIFSRDMVDELQAGAVLKYLLRPLAAARHLNG